MATAAVTLVWPLASLSTSKVPFEYRAKTPLSRVQSPLNNNLLLFGRRVIPKIGSGGLGNISVIFGPMKVCVVGAQKSRDIGDQTQNLHKQGNCSSLLQPKEVVLFLLCRESYLQVSTTESCLHPPSLPFDVIVSVIPPGFLPHSVLGLKHVFAVNWRSHILLWHQGSQPTSRVAWIILKLSASPASLLKERRSNAELSPGPYIFKKCESSLERSGNLFLL